jgi:hypothetical protein
MARGLRQPLNDRRSSVRKASPTWRFTFGAGDGNRTRTISLGICAVRACIGLDLRGRQSVSALERPLVTGVNGPLMARRSSNEETNRDVLITCCRI